MRKHRVTVHISRLPADLVAEILAARPDAESLNDIVGCVYLVDDENVCRGSVTLMSDEWCAKATRVSCRHCDIVALQDSPEANPATESTSSCWECIRERSRPFRDLVRESIRRGQESAVARAVLKAERWLGEGDRADSEAVVVSLLAALRACVPKADLNRVVKEAEGDVPALPAKEER